jgi:hypothetical protein
MSYNFTDWNKLNIEHKVSCVRYVWDETLLVGSFLIIYNSNENKYNIKYCPYSYDRFLNNIFNLDFMILYSSEEEAKSIVDKSLSRLNNLIPFI